MANNTELDNSTWAQQHLAAAQPDSLWEPDMPAGLARLNARLAQPSPARRLLVSGLVIAAASLAALLIWHPTDGPIDVQSTAPMAVNGQLSPPSARWGAPSLATVDVTGNSVPLSDFEGQVILLNFWATWCRPCLVEMPWFEEVSNQLGAEGLTVLGVSLDEQGWDDILLFLGTHDVNYQILTLQTPYDAVQVLPTTLLIDRTGRVAATHTGIVDRATLEDQIAELIAE